MQGVRCEKPARWNYRGESGAIPLCDGHEALLEIAMVLHGVPLDRRKFRRIRPRAQTRNKAQSDG